MGIPPSVSSLGPPARRPLVAALVVAALGLAAAAPPALAQFTPRPPPATREATIPPPPASAEPPTSPPPAPTRPPGGPPVATPVAPTPGVEDDDEPAPPPPPGGATDVPASAPTSAATRTRRPTRTPRTTPTLTPTPLAAGALRLSLSAQPASAPVGGAMTLVATLANQGLGPVGDLTLRVVVPKAVLVDRIDPGPGQAAQVGGLVSWYVALLAPGAQASVRLGGVVARAEPEGARLCAVLLSAGAPVEHCIEVGTTAAAGTEAPAAVQAPALPTALPAARDLSATVTPSALRWGVLALGLGVLGLWFGLRRRAAGGGIAASGP